jgi:hypothetical protein
VPVLLGEPGMELSHVLVVEAPLDPRRLSELRGAAPCRLRPGLLYRPLPFRLPVLLVAAFYEGVYLSLCGLGAPG